MARRANCTPRACIRSAGPKADREAADADPLPGGGKEVPRLVHHDQLRQDRQCGENAHSGRVVHGPIAPGLPGDGRLRGDN